MRGIHGDITTYSGASKKSISYWQQSDVGKAVNFPVLPYSESDTILLEAQGLWWGNGEDHIAGARQLAKKSPSAVLEKSWNLPPRNA